MIVSLRAAMIRSVARAVLVLCILNLDVIHAGKCRFRQAQHNAVFVTTCEARCWNYQNQTRKQSCMTSCTNGGMRKPGSCPDENGPVNTTISPFAAVCLDMCKKDSQCPGVLKCCKHHCGITCQEPTGLQTAEDVPPIPTEITIKERRRKKAILIEWKPGEYLSKGTIIYIIEERHYMGKNLVDDRMGAWTACLRTNKTSVKHLLQPARWYNFRVAAVNENGTRGFSEPSISFKISTGPRPPKKPENVTVGPLFFYNGTLYTEIKWSPPLSDLPIQRYNIFWSRRLQGAKDSVLVHQQSVSKDENKFVLHELQPNSSYFLQIQAIVHYGNERLRGEKSGKLFNTSDYINTSGYEVSTELVSTYRVDDLDLKKPFWSHGSLRARIIWKFRKNFKYNVTWWSSSCENGDKEHIKLMGTTKGSHFDLYNLQFNCRYKVSVRQFSQKASKLTQDTSLTFRTPSCEDLSKRNRRVRCVK